MVERPQIATSYGQVYPAASDVEFKDTDELRVTVEGLIRYCFVFNQTKSKRER